MDKQKKLIIIGAVAVLILVIGVVIANSMSNKPTENSQTPTTSQDETPAKKEVKKPASFTEGYEQVEVGMSKADVEVLLGTSMSCKIIEIKQLNQKMETCTYKDPASTAPESLADATVDFDEDGKVLQKQKY